MKSSKLANLVAALFIATLFKFLINLMEDNGLSWDDPQSSVLNSHRAGVYICAVQAEPKTFLWNGKTISFQEIWIERRVHMDHPLIWLSRTTLSGGYYLCFTLLPKHLFKSDSSFFVCDEGDFGGGVEMINDGSFFDSWLKPNAILSHSANLRLTRSWHDDTPVKVRFTW